jgi:hypothetical protein
MNRKIGFTGSSLNSICIPAPNKNSNFHCGTPVNINHTTTRQPQGIPRRPRRTAALLLASAPVTMHAEIQRTADVRGDKGTYLAHGATYERVSTFKAVEVHGDVTGWRAVRCDPGTLPGPLLMIRWRQTARVDWPELGRGGNQIT